ncbi:neutral amino acid permease [Rhizodiscina lignyota]|uniref:Neutral amino acid permease n=1 Tax=Rhizodiscina lignyota TaxID=1504668 RepID=A0A9P4M9J9_9PEZI|nr:neutral amino acid permease [Rhizodiscina lignyota]
MSEKELGHDAEKGHGKSSVEVGTVGVLVEDGVVYDNEHEVFRKDDDAIDYRTVGMKRALFVMFKVVFSLGILSLPSTLFSLGALGGALSVIGWGLLNTYCAILIGNFRHNHTTCHSIVDMGMILGGKVLKETCGVLFLLGWILAVGASILGVSTGLNALSSHATCTVWWSFITYIVVALGASLPKFHSLGWITWIGSASIFTAVFIIVIAVTTRDRPAAAPQSGPYELGYFVIGSPSFISGMVASLNIFNSSAGANSFIPLMAEMKRPKDFNKAVIIVMSFSGACYIAFSLVIYRWCGQWVTSPSLASAGPVIEKVCYGIALPGLLAIALLCLHVASKYLFVRILRKSPHLQAKSAIHWITWFSCTFGLGTLSFIMAEAIPVFNYLLALNASVCFAPLAIMIPGACWLYDHKSYRKGSMGQKVFYWSHYSLLLFGAFFLVGGTYATIQSIITSNQTNGIGKPFDCANDA